MRSLSFILVALALAACGDDKPASGEDGTGAPAPTVSAPATEDGLASVFRSLLEDIRAGNNARIDEQLSALALPDAKAFFAAHFPEDMAARLASDYADKATHLPEIADLLRTQLDKGRDQIAVEKFDAQEDPRALGYQNLALKQMTDRIPIYSVRVVAQGESVGFHLWSFVHDGSQFRWVGKLKGVKPGLEGDKDRLLELRLEEARRLDAE